MLETSWLNYAKENNFRYILILKDLEDKELYPVYFHESNEIEKYIHTIVSESKIKVISEIDILK